MEEKEDRIDIEKTHLKAALLIWLQMEHPNVYTEQYVEAFEKLWGRLRKQNGVRK